MKYFLIKSEPNTRIVKGIDVKFSIKDLKKDVKTTWDGVRNFEARNIIQEMKVGDLCLFYHSNCKVPGIAGLAKVVKNPYADHTAFDSSHYHYDPKSDINKPTWFMVDVEFVCEFDRFLTLKELQAEPSLKNMPLLVRSRLSVQRVDKSFFDVIMKMQETKN